MIKRVKGKATSRQTETELLLYHFCPLENKCSHPVGGTSSLLLAHAASEFSCSVNDDLLNSSNRIFVLNVVGNELILECKKTAHYIHAHSYA